MGNIFSFARCQDGWMEGVSGQYAAFLQVTAELVKPTARLSHWRYAALADFVEHSTFLKPAEPQGV